MIKVRSVGFPVFVAIVIILAMFASRKAGEDYTVDGIIHDYMESTGNEYEDTLVSDLSERYDGEILIYDSDEVSLELLENRDGLIIVERCYGIVVSEEYDGKVLNPYDKEFDYISYRDCVGFGDIRDGTLMVTYLVYNPETDYCDDILERYDCVVSHELED